MAEDDPATAAMDTEAPEAAAPDAPSVPATGYPVASLPAGAGMEPDDDDDELFVDINECRDFEDGDDPDAADEEMVADGLDDEEAGPDQAELTLENSGSVLCVAASPTEALVCTGNQDDKAVLFRLGEGGVASTVTLEGHTDSVVSVAFSTDGAFVATASYDNTVRVWSPQGALVHKLDGPAGEVEWVVWHPKGNALLAGSNDCTAWLWWAPSAKLMQVFAGHSAAVGCGCFANQGKSIVTGSTSGELIVWNPKQGTTVHMMQGLHEHGVLCVRAHPSMPIVATGGFDGGVAVIQVETGKELAKLSGHEKEVEAVDFFESASVHLLATGGIDGTVRIYDCQQWNLRAKITTVEFGNGGVTFLRWHPTEPWVISTGADCRVRVHDARSGAEVAARSGHRKDVYEFAVLVQDQVRVVTASDDGTAKVFAL